MVTQASRQTQTCNLTRGPRRMGTKQVSYARQLAQDLGEEVPPEAVASKSGASAWIKTAKARLGM